MNLRKESIYVSLSLSLNVSMNMPFNVSLSVNVDLNVVGLRVSFSVGNSKLEKQLKFFIYFFFII